jgi:hypothetical protein
MNVVLWFAQALLAAVFLLAGFPKATRSIDALSKRMDWVRAVPPGFVRCIGAAELLGAVGLVLPLATGILPWLTVAAAVGLVLVQVSAGAFHLSRGEAAVVPGNIVLLLLAVFVVIGRVAVVQMA